MLKITLATCAILLLAPTAGQASVRNYFLPNVEGARLDSCLAGQNDCGKPAADAFCVTQGYTQALIFQREPASSTRQLGSNLMCTTGSCISFRQIKCTSPADLATNQ